VFVVVAAGMANKQIAARLGISLQKLHRGRSMRKLQLRSLAKLVRLAEKERSVPAQPCEPALDQGLVPPPPPPPTLRTPVSSHTELLRENLPCLILVQPPRSDRNNNRLRTRFLRHPGSFRVRGRALPLRAGSEDVVIEDLAPMRR
jgi:hypothetical protein